jgi:hypothetical protein
MNQNRLEGVLARNRKHLVLDLALAALFLMALVFTGLTFGHQLPKLSMAPQAAAVEMARTPTAKGGVKDAVQFAAADDTSPQTADH